MSTPEFSTHVGQDCGSELLENSQILSVLKIEDKMGDDISQTGEADGVNFKEDADHHSADVCNSILSQRNTLLKMAGTYEHDYCLGSQVLHRTEN